MMSRSSLLFVFLFVFAMLFTQPVIAQERMRIAWAGSTPSNTPIWVGSLDSCIKGRGDHLNAIRKSMVTRS